MATAPDRERRGYARRVLRALAEAVQPFDVAALSPSDPAFYAPLGWELWRGPLLARRDDQDEMVEDEQVMILRLPASPPLDLTAPLGTDWRSGDVW